MSHTIIGQELQLLAKVSTALSALSSQNEGSPDFDTALINLRDQIAEAKPEDIAALVEQMMRISAIAQRYGKGRDLPVNPQSPYFAHLRLQEDERTRDVLIGKRGFVDRRHHVQIVDWRNAPVSRIYYRYEEGDDYEEHFGEKTLEGMIQARRSLTIDEGKLRRIGCPQATLIADESGVWYEAESVTTSCLSGGQGTATRPPAFQSGRKDSKLGLHSGSVLRADKHLPEIAALIDPTQFDLITKPESGLIVLQGGAGSGKTTVALHRVAYLNYAMPGRFRGDRMIVLVPSQAMVRYVERVLPSLGVKGIPVLRVRDWFEKTRRKTLPFAPKGYNPDPPPGVLRFKKHPFLLHVFRQRVDQQLEQLEQELQSVIHDPRQLELVLEKWHDLSTSAPIPRCASLRTWMDGEPRLSALAMQQGQALLTRMSRKMKDIVADWAEVLTDRSLLMDGVLRYCPDEFSAEDIEQVCHWCSQQSEEAAEHQVSSSNTRRSSPTAVNKVADLLDEQLDDIDLVEATQHQATSVDGDDDPYLSLDGVDERVSSMCGRLDPPDDALLLYLVQLKYGQLRTPGAKTISYEHLVVDEAQDLSVMETKVLMGCTSKLRSITLAGDTAQRSVFDNYFNDWETLLEQIGMQAATNKTLRLGYRSTEQIMELARHLMVPQSPVTEITPLRRGTAVELHRFSEQGESVALLAEALRSLEMREPLASVALIARYPEQARAYFEVLHRSEVPGIRLVNNQEFSFRPGIDVTDVNQVKGLEFDYVILLDVTAANYPDTIENRHLLYIGATRAAHQLWIMSVGRPSSILPAEVLTPALT